MIDHHSNPIMQKLRRRFASLYGAAADRCLERIAMLAGRYGTVCNDAPPKKLWNEKDAILITYGDMVRNPGEMPLQTLKRFADNRLQGAINTIHILPFFPYSSDDGFSIIDYRRVRQDLGTWGDIEKFRKKFHLMFDLVPNHVSQDSAWFSEYVRGIAPARNYFIETSPKADLSKVARPRNTPLLVAASTPYGTRHLWTTFGGDQIDLDFRNPDVLFEFLDILLLYVSHGARIIRLDAIAYIWKKIGTSCIHLPEVHVIVRIMRDLLSIVAPEVLLLTETNVTHKENLAYFGEGDGANMVYQFSLPPLLVHALYTGQTRFLTSWAASLPLLPAGCAFLNFTASHDGIGLRPLEGLLPPREVGRVIKGALRRGAQISTRKRSNGSKTPYEINCSYFDVLADADANDPAMDIVRFMCSQTVALALKGIPAVYFNSLMGAHNDCEEAERTGRARSLNRKKWDLNALEAALGDEASVSAIVFSKYVRLLRLRSSHAAFHPDGEQKVHDLGKKVFALERVAPDRSETVVSISNFTSEKIVVDTKDKVRCLKKAAEWQDLITGLTSRNTTNTICLGPYETQWLWVQTLER